MAVCYTRTLIFVVGISMVLGSCAKIKLARETRYMQRTYAALRDTLNEAEVTIIKDSVKVLFPHNLIFAFDKAIVRPDFMPVLQRFAGVLQAHDKTGILITGHTDSIGGNNQRNMLLSFRRADSARAVLQYNGIQEQRMDSWGLGAKMPIATNKTEEGRQQNRRVEFVVLYNYRTKKRGE